MFCFVFFLKSDLFYREADLFVKLKRNRTIGIIERMKKQNAQTARDEDDWLYLLSCMTEPQRFHLFSCMITSSLSQKSGPLCYS